VQSETGSNILHPAGLLTYAVSKVTLSVAVSDSGGVPQYQRILRFGQAIASNPQRADIVDMTVSATDNSVRNAAFVLDVWRREEPPK
jgi:hypothetical protein